MSKYICKVFKSLKYLTYEIVLSFTLIFCITKIFLIFYTVKKDITSYFKKADEKFILYEITLCGQKS